MNSPLGKYSQAVAAAIAIAVVAAFILALLLHKVLGLSDGDVSALEKFALIAIGAVFGSAATINGVKAPLEAAHNRIDKIETATGIPTHGAYPVTLCGCSCESCKALGAPHAAHEGHPPGATVLVETGPPPAA